MFAREQKQEYDPTSVPLIERPLAKQVQGNAYGGPGLDGLRSEERNHRFGHKRSESKTSLPLYSPTKTPLASNGNAITPVISPSKVQVSPTKSSLSNRYFNSKGIFDPENGTWSEETSGEEHELPEGRSLHHHAKSVTFDAAPPQINEYEMTTPDLSSVGTGSRENSYDSVDEEDDQDSYNRADSVDRDDSFDESLEDTDKTPVVEPDDWRHASPSTQHGPMTAHFEDPFEGPEGSPMPGTDPSIPAISRPIISRTESNGDHRPLPPIPGVLGNHVRSSSQSSSGISAAAERASSAPRGLPIPPRPASISKSEIQGMTGGKMSLEERLRLMMIQDDDNPKSAAEEQRERRMRRAGHREHKSVTPEQGNEIHIHEDEDTLGDLGDYQLPPRISRESILRKINGQDEIEEEAEYALSSPAPSSSPSRPTILDPDVPLPSTEDRSILETGDASDSVIIKTEEDEVDVYSIADMYHEQRSDSSHDSYGEIGSMAQHDSRNEEDSDSQYSTPKSVNQSPDTGSSHSQDEDGPPTPRAASPFHQVPVLEPNGQDKGMALPEFAGFMTGGDFGLSLQSYMTPSPPPVQEAKLLQEPASTQSLLEPPRPFTPPDHPQLLSKPEYDGSGWGPEEEECNPGTPDSVIHHPISREPSPARASPIVPEQVATIKGTSGSKLKTRPSATPSDLVAMREARRQISGELPNIPPIPQRHRSRPSLNSETSPVRSFLDEEDEGEVLRKPSLKKRSLTLDIGDDLGLSLDKDFDRRGYLMRQNTKVVIASSDADTPDHVRGYRSAGNSPVKHDRPQSWTVEPWNGQTRQKSVRDPGSARKKNATGPVPPLPGQESNVAGLASLTEEEASVDPSTNDTSERTWFSLTLDNGVHCVTTAWLELGKSAPIGQEFELVVPNDLEFQLTLNAKLEKPAPRRVIETPVRVAKPQKVSTFSRVFTSPKKRKELEIRQREEEARLTQQQKQRDAQAKRLTSQATAWDLLSPLAAEDGSFGRAYISLKDHESRCFGRPYLVDVACFNEWATEEAGALSSVKSKRGNTHVQRRAPYKIGKLELQLLFVPKPKGAKDEDMPKSMNSCIREMKEVEAAMARSYEGHLSQQGGDCPYWRRRFFKLCGNKLTAYHESTGQPRATINLANASKLIDDRRALTQRETTGKGGSRRKSGFAEEEEGYMFVEEGFRIRFANGEVIDFYAGSANDKEGWMKVLDQCIGKLDDGKGPKSGKWCEVVLRREESLMRKKAFQQQGRKPSGQSGRSGHARTKSMIT
ncbi:MAG: Bud site selection protein bud4 [Claussenomyces sp. TS43310]|nr:MAG: Bud site selection protein bud4 [Claussenomyces sp. TS43310]